MPPRVSTNRDGWQMRGKSSAKACDPALNPISGLDSGPDALNHNQKLRTALAAKTQFLV